MSSVAAPYGAEPVGTLSASGSFTGKVRHYPIATTYGTQISYGDFVTIVAGGGVALIRAQQGVKALKLEGDESLGANIICRALEEPLRIIVTNAGHEASVVVNKVKEEKGSQGFDAKNGVYVDMVAEGIIDPAKVVRTAIQNAASIAGLLLTTEATITVIPEEKKEASHASPGMGGMGGMY